MYFSQILHYNDPHDSGDLVPDYLIIHWRPRVDKLIYAWEPFVNLHFLSYALGTDGYQVVSDP